MRRGYVIVAERFVVDWVVSLAFVVQDHSFVNSHISNLALRCIPSHSLLIYIDANYDVITTRRAIEDSNEFIEFQRSCYDIFANKLHVMRIDTSNKNIDQVFKLIKDYIFQDDLKH